MAAYHRLFNSLYTRRRHPSKTQHGHRADNVQSAKNEITGSVSNQVTQALEPQVLGSSTASSPAISDTGLSLVRPTGPFASGSGSQVSNSVGLHLLYAPPGDQKAPDTAVDIVAVHGLNGKPLSTWTWEPRWTLAGSQSRLWLRDFLPKAIPGARIFTFGYDAAIRNNSTAAITEFALELLDSIMNERDGKVHRPLIFVAHSLGGLVCKQALTFAQNRVEFHDIFVATKAVLFFGTPHRGSVTADAAGLVERLVPDILGVRGDLLKDLKTNSPRLRAIEKGFEDCKKFIITMSYYETRRTNRVCLIVPMGSAVLDEEFARPIGRDHRQMCRFEHEHDYYYVFVKTFIRRIAKMATSGGFWTPISREFRSPLSAREFESGLSKLEALARQHTKVPSLERVDGTCEWLLEQRQFSDWLSNRGPSVLWITGEYGCGKTVLSSYIIETISNLASVRTYGHSRPCNLCYYFCDNKTSRQNDLLSMLGSLLFQLISSQPEVAHYAMKAIHESGPWFFERFQLLLQVIHQTLKDPDIGTTIFIIDAIDECEDLKEEKHAAQFKQLLSSGLIEHSDGLEQRCRVLVTTRPHSNIAQDFKDVSIIPLERQECLTYVSRDVDLVIAKKTQELTKARHCPEFQAELESELRKNAERTFLWVTLTMENMMRSPFSAPAKFLSMIEKLPKDLTTLYDELLMAIEDNDRPQSAQIFSIIAEASRPMELAEVNIAQAMREEHTTMAEVRRYCEPVIERTLRKICPLIRITDGEVGFFHSSVKEYLCNVQTASLHDFRVERGPANLLMARICVSYLLLEEFRENDIFEEISPEAQSPSFSSTEDPYIGFGPDMPEEVSEIVSTSHLRAVGQKHPFFDYCATNWVEHAIQADDDLSHDQQLISSIINTCDSRLLTNWLRYYWSARCPWLKYPKYIDCLGIASYFGLKHVVTSILARGWLKGAQLTGPPALHWACMAPQAMSHHTEVVGILIENGSHPNATYDQWQPLGRAVLAGNLNVVKSLVMNGASLNDWCALGRTALSLSIAEGHLAIFDYLIDLPTVDAGVLDNNGASSLLHAMEEGRVEVVKKLLNKRSFDLNYQDRSGRTVLSWAAAKGHSQVVELFMNSSPSPGNLPDRKNQYPIDYAAQHGHLRILEMLGEHYTTSFEAQDNINGMNVVMHAAGSQHYHLFDYLVQRYPDGFKVQDFSGNTALRHALINYNARSVDTAQALLKTGLVDTETEDDDGLTALVKTAGSGCVEHAEVLLQYGANMEHRTHKGATALHHAVATGRFYMVDFLLGKGANTRAETVDGVTPLSEAIFQEHFDIVKLLIGKGMSSLDVRIRSLHPGQTTQSLGEWARARGVKVKRRKKSKLAYGKYRGMDY